MEKNVILKISASAFGLIALIHLVLLFVRMDILIGSFDVPMWLRLIVFIVSGYLSVELFRM